jgi:hypothetical protein
MANPPAAVSDASSDDQAAKANNALWYAFHGIGRAYLIRRGSAAAGVADTSAVHGYSTIEQAESNANQINAASQAAITQWDEWASLPAGGGTLGVVETVNITWSGNTATSSTPQNPTTAAAGQLPGLAQIGDFFHRLTEAATWIRLAKVVIGGALVLIGVAHMTGFSGSAGNAARAVPLPI